MRKLRFHEKKLLKKVDFLQVSRPLQRRAGAPRAAAGTVRVRVEAAGGDHAPRRTPRACAPTSRRARLHAARSRR